MLAPTLLATGATYFKVPTANLLRAEVRDAAEAPIVRTEDRGAGIPDGENGRSAADHARFRLQITAWREIGETARDR